MDGNASLKFELDACNDYMKLFVLMYADDTVLLANSERGLQRALHSLEKYCIHWKLKVNIAKTTVMLFGKQRMKKDKYNFMFGNSKLEVVDSFKYLGITFNYNGKFTVAKKRLLAQASKAMFVVLNRVSALKLPMDIQLQLFKCLVEPVLTYGCEVWGYEDCRLLERLHLKFCKYVLGLKRSTPNAMVYGELGSYPVQITIKYKVIGYWLRLIASKENKLSHIMYKMLLKLYNDNVYKSPWLKFVHSTLDACGLSFVWAGQTEYFVFNQGWVLLTVKRVLQDQFVQEWQESLANVPHIDYLRNFF